MQRWKRNYKVGQLIHFYDAEYVDTGDPIISNAVDDFVARIEKVFDDKLEVTVLKVNTKDIRGRWRETINRTIGKIVTLYHCSDEKYINCTEMSDILYG